MKKENSDMEDMMSTAEDTLQKLSSRMQQTVNKLAEKIAESSEEVLHMADNTQSSAQRLAVERAKFRFATRLQEAGFQYLLEVEEKASEIERRLESMNISPTSRAFLEGQLASVRQTRDDLMVKTLKIDSNLLLEVNEEEFNEDSKAKIHSLDREDEQDRVHDVGHIRQELDVNEEEFNEDSKAKIHSLDRGDAQARVHAVGQVRQELDVNEEASSDSEGDVRQELHTQEPSVKSSVVDVSPSDSESPAPVEADNIEDPTLVRRVEPFMGGNGAD